MRPQPPHQALGPRVFGFLVCAALAGAAEVGLLACLGVIQAYGEPLGSGSSLPTFVLLCGTILAGLIGTAAGVLTAKLVHETNRWKQTCELLGEELRQRRDESTRLVSERKELAAQLEEMTDNLHSANILHEQATRRFQGLFHGVPIACFAYDSEGLVYEWNRASEELYGMTSAEMFQKSIWSTICPPDAQAETRTILSRVFRGEAVEGFEWVDRRPDGSVRHLLCSALPMRGHDGEVVGAINANVDISGLKAVEVELETANAQLMELATNDGLTGLKNHRVFREELGAVFHRASRYGEQLSLILFDLDRFKDYNDTYGHLAGDHILRQTGSLLRDAIRRSDSAARYGGEEFVVILPSAGSEEAMAFAERLRQTFAQAGWPGRPITASFGVSTIRRNIADPADLIELADKAMYASKQFGRNRVTHSDSIDDRRASDSAA